MFELAEAAVEGALAAGAGYADARAMVIVTEGLSARDGVLERMSRNESAGVGVRALIGSSWGFFATPDPDGRRARRAGEEAAAIAEASALVAGPPMALADVGVAQAHWDSPCDEHPFSVPLSERGDLLVEATATMKGVHGVGVASAYTHAWDTHKWFVSSQGHRISQHLV
ncbi:MAG: TldD/PmbA family protein, partial [Actinomycetota bacterium]|nr:TldD/PmbA family protein [Actinomycetota bacterium]